MASGNTSRVGLVLAVIALVLSGLVSTQIEDIRKVADHQHYNQTEVGAVAFGFNTIAADVMWIGLVQDLGMITGDMTDVQATEFFERFDKIAQLDPSFSKAIQLGGLRLSVIAPDKSLTILERGAKRVNTNNKDPWKVPFYGAVVGAGYVKDRIHGLTRAIELSQQSIGLGAPEYVRRFNNMSKVRLKIEQGDLVGALAYRQSLIAEPKPIAQPVETAVKPGDPMMPTMTAGVGPDLDMTSRASLSIYRDQLKELAEQILADDKTVVKNAKAEQLAEAKVLAQKVLAGS